MKMLRFLLSPALALLVAAPLSAQSVAAGAGVKSGDSPPWLRAWSPLAPIADQPRGLPRAPSLPDLLGSPAPRVGLLWTAGNPAGAAFELEGERGEIRAGRAAESGNYRRPLDEDEVTVRQLAGLRWQPLTSSTAGIGRVVADETTADIGSPTGAAFRHGSSPFIVVDTTAAGMRHVRARLEGALGWRRGGWAVGMGLGLEVSDDRTRQAPVPRTVRSSTPAVSLGVARALPIADARLSAYGRWVGGAESVWLIPRLEQGSAFRFSGYADPGRVTFDGTIFSRPVERSGYAVGLAASGSSLGVDWALFGESHRRTDEHFSQFRRADAPRDEWRADGWRAGAATMKALAGDRLRVFVRGEYSTLEGDAFLSELEAIVFDARENRFQSLLDVRYGKGAWEAGTRFILEREARIRRDFIIELGSDIVGWRPGGALEVARRFGSGTDVSIGYAMAAYTPVSIVPSAGALSPAYQQFLAPETAFYATRALAMSGSGTLRHRLGEGPALLLRASWERVGDRGGEPPLPLAPAGERTLWHLSVGMIWGG